MKFYKLIIILFLFSNGLSAQLPSYVPTNGLVSYWGFDGNANDESSYGNHGSVSGATLTSDRFGRPNSAYYFSGLGCATGITANVNTATISTGLTLSFWLYKSADACLNPRLMEFYPGSDGPGQLQITWLNGMNSFTLQHTTSTGYNTSYSYKCNSLSWHHIVYTNDGNMASYYQDGILVEATPSRGLPVLSGNVSFGRLNHGGHDAFNGNLDDIAIYNRALTPCEIAQLFSSNIFKLSLTITPSGPTTFCDGNSVNLSVTSGAGFSYQWNQNGTIINAATSATYHTNQSGNYNVVVTSGSGCKVTSPAEQVTVNPLPIVPPISGPTSVCLGSVISLNDSTKYGTWNISNPEIATISTNGIVTGIKPGSSSIYYSVKNSFGCLTVVSSSITVNELPKIAEIQGPAEVCAGSTIQLQDANSGGVWVSSNVNIATIAGIGAVNGISAGATEITYTITNTNGCINSVRKAIKVNALPAVPTIMGASSICVGNKTTLINAVKGGKWMSSNTIVATINDNGEINAVTPGSTNINYLVTNNTGCSNRSSFGVTINPLPVIAPITGMSSVCEGEIIQLADATVNGTWSNNDTSIAKVSNTGSVHGIKAGNATIVYTATNINGCTNSNKTTIVVNPLPKIPAITGNTKICVGGTTYLSKTMEGGRWYCINSSVATVNVNGMVTGISPGIAGVNYSATNSLGCTNSTTTAVNVFGLPKVPAISGTTSMCAGSTIKLTNPSVFKGTWSTPNSTLATINDTGIVTGIAAGTAIVSYTIKDDNSCVNSVISNLTINPLPVVTPVSGNTSVCVGYSSSLYEGTPGGIWSSSGTNIASINELGIVSGISAGTANISYTLTNGYGCTNIAFTKYNVNPLPQIRPITGASSLCAGSVITLIDSTNDGTWQSSNALVAPVSSNGIVTGLAEGNTIVTYSVTNNNGCSNSSTLPVTVNPLPIVAPIKTISPICAGSTIMLNEETPNGVWSSAYPFIATINNNGIVTGVEAGTSLISYILTNESGCKNFTTISVIVNPLPVVSPISGNMSVCESSTSQLANPTPGGVWSSSSTSFATIKSDGLLTGITAGASIITYTVTNNENGCINNNYATVTINPLPYISPIKGPASFCVGSTYQLTDSAQNGIWSISNNSIATISSTGVITGISSGRVNANYTITNNNGCTNTTSASFLIDALPILTPISGASNVCVGATTTLTETSPNGTWSSSNNSVLTIGADGVVKGINPGSAIITYTLKAGSCTISSDFLVSAYVCEH